MELVFILLKTILTFFPLILAYLDAEYKACQDFYKMFVKAIYTSLDFDSLGLISILKDCNKGSMNDKEKRSFSRESLCKVIYKHFYKEMIQGKFYREIYGEMMLKQFL